jgi:hypothetical protein
MAYARVSSTETPHCGGSCGGDDADITRERNAFRFTRLIHYTTAWPPSQQVYKKQHAVMQPKRDDAIAEKQEWFDSGYEGILGLALSPNYGDLPYLLACSRALSHQLGL